MAQILVFGDSLTDGAFDRLGGWATRVHRRFMADKASYLDQRTPFVPSGEELHWFYNLGISGDTARDVLARVDGEARARHVHRTDKRAVLVFAVGVNDSAADGSPDNVRVSKDAFRAHVRELARRATPCGRVRVVFVGLMPVLEELTSPIYGTTWYSNSRIQEFDEVLRGVAAETGTGFVDLLDSSDVGDLSSDHFVDGLHPSTLGHAWMYRRILPAIDAALRTRSASTINQSRRQPTAQSSRVSSPAIPLPGRET